MSEGAITAGTGTQVICSAAVIVPELMRTSPAELPAVPTKCWDETAEAIGQDNSAVDVQHGACRRQYRRR